MRALPRRKIERNADFIAGRPDVYIPSLKLAVFAHGCFWHSCRLHGSMPKTNGGYWGPKLERNAVRDLQIQRKLRRSGIGVWSVWEHDLRGKRLAETEERLAIRLKKRVISMKARGS